MLEGCLARAKEVAMCAAALEVHITESGLRGPWPLTSLDLVDLDPFAPPPDLGLLLEAEESTARGQ
eukprot:9501592-Pyramimonas_sp.AAC.1